MRRLLLERVGQKGQDLLVLIQKQHGAEVAQTLVRKQGTGSQLQTFDLTKVGRVAKHMDVKQLGDVGVAKLGVFLLEGSTDECRLFLDDSTLIGVSLAGTDGLDEVYVGKTAVVLKAIGRRFFLSVTWQMW